MHATRCAGGTPLSTWSAANSVYHGPPQLWYSGSDGRASVPSELKLAHAHSVLLHDTRHCRDLVCASCRRAAPGLCEEDRRMGWCGSQGGVLPKGAA